MSRTDRYWYQQVLVEPAGHSTTVGGDYTGVHGCATHRAAAEDGRLPLGREAEQKASGRSLFQNQGTGVYTGDLPGEVKSGLQEAQ
jgi:hypothetical protein